LSRLEDLLQASIVIYWIPQNSKAQSQQVEISNLSIFYDVRIAKPNKYSKLECFLISALPKLFYLQHCDVESNLISNPPFLLEKIMDFLWQRQILLV